MSEDIEIQKLMVEMGLNMRRIESQQNRMLKKFDTTFRSIEETGKKRLTNVERQAEQMSRNVRRAIAGIAVGVLVREGLDLERTWRNATNTMRQYSDVLGEAGQATRDITAIANEAGVAVGTLSGVTGAAARAARTLGASGSDVLTFIEAVSKGSALANTGVAGVEGAMVQLSQAIASPRVQLQEFNSIIEGTPRLAQAFAQGVLGAGGDIATLRAEIAAGNVSGEQLFQGLISQVGLLREEFSTLEQGPEQAFARLRNNLAQFVGENETAVGAAQGLAGAINWVADNLDLLTDAIVVGSAALAGWAGTSGLVAAYAALRNVAAGATASARAVALLSSATRFFGGPLVIAITAIAGAIALIALNSRDAGEALDAVEQTMGRFNRVQSDIESDTRALEQANTALGEAMRNQGEIAQNTAALEVAAIQDRIAKNRELAESYRAIIGAQLAQARSAFEAEEDRVLGRYRPRQNTGAFGRRMRRDDPEGWARIQAERDAQGREALIADREALQARLNEGGSLSREESERLQVIAALEEHRINLDELSARYEALNEVSTGESEVSDDTPPPGGGGGGGTEYKRALDEIRAAHRALGESERDQIARLRDERIASINAALDAEEIAADEASRLREQAGEVYLAQLAEIDKAEAEQKQIQLQRIQEQADAEARLVGEVLDMRDYLFGCTASLLDREYEHRREVIERSIKDEARRNEALAALNEERQRAEADLSDELLQRGEYSQDPVERLRARHELELIELQDALDRKLILEEEYLERRNQMEMEADAAMASARLQNQQTILSSSQRFFGSLTQLARQRLGENNAITKALFLAEQAAAAAQVYINMEVAKMRALAELGPVAGPPAASAIHVAGMLSLATIAAQTIAGFKDGVVGFRGKGGPRSDSNLVAISDQESVITAAGTFKNRNVLEAINDGADIEAMINRLVARDGGVMPVPVGVGRGPVGTLRITAPEGWQAELDQQGSRLAQVEQASSQLAKAVGTISRFLQKQKRKGG